MHHVHNLIQFDINVFFWGETSILINFCTDYLRTFEFLVEIMMTVYLAHFKRKVILTN